MKKPLAIISFLLLPALVSAEEAGQVEKKAASVVTPDLITSLGYS